MATNTGANEQKPTYKHETAYRGQEDGQTKKAHQNANKATYSADFEAWATKNEQTGGKYLLDRGISLETQKRFKVGYCSAWTNPKGSKYTDSRIIFPTTDSTYIARATSPTCEKAFKAIAVGNRHPFALKEALEEARLTGKPVFLVEGETDALSFWEMEFPAVALGGVTQWGNFFRDLRAILKPPFPRFVVALDWDSEGRKHTKTYLNGLEDLGLLAIESAMFPTNIEALDTYRGIHNFEEQRPEDWKAFAQWLEEPLQNSLKATFYKDPNDYLRAGKMDFLTFYNVVAEELEQKEAKERESYSDPFRDVFTRFCQGADRNQEHPTPTGFATLDRILNGGLENRLYVLGAVPSLGKSTLMLQMAMNIAEGGRDVLFFALEMGASELISKSLSSLTCRKAIERKVSLGYARTATEVFRRDTWKDFPKISKELLNTSVSYYGANIDPHLYIFEGLGEIGLTDIKGAIEKHKRATGRAPVVVVDYLQIMKIEDDSRGLTDKQIVDRNILAFKKISKEEGLPVLVVSAFSRNNYQEEAGQASFKESGAIEYGADVLLALQLEIVNSEEYRKKGNTDSDKRRLIKEALRACVGGVAQRKYDLQILKNRSGELGSVSLKYFPAYNYYREGEPTPTREQSDPEATPTEEELSEEAPF